MLLNPNIDVDTILMDGTLELEGEFIWGSNYTFLLRSDYQNTSVKVVYKPSKGEQPLWDFESESLAKREVAAYLVSEALSWKLVPPTVYRDNAPFGPGSLQLYIEHNPEYHYFNFSNQDRQRLRPVALFDLLINNADRKGSHIIIDNQNHIWLIDHGICFHEDIKLRTVIWDFAGEPFPDSLQADLKAFINQIKNANGNNSGSVNLIKEYLSASEMMMLQKRAEALLNNPRFPQPRSNRRDFPWPLL